MIVVAWRSNYGRYLAAMYWINEKNTLHTYEEAVRMMEKSHPEGQWAVFSLPENTSNPLQVARTMMMLGHHGIIKY